MLALTLALISGGENAARIEPAFDDQIREKTGHSGTTRRQHSWDERTQAALANFWISWDYPIAATTILPSLAAANNKGWLLRGHWRMILHSYWPTSRREILMTRARKW